MSVLAGRPAFAVLAALALTLGCPPVATAEEVPRVKPRGMVFEGLSHADRGPCAGAFEVEVPGLGRICTAGPDPAPAHIDVSAVSEMAGSSTVDPATLGLVPCIGDGMSGQRVQAVYVVASDKADNYSAEVPRIHAIASRMDAAIVQSAAATGGERHIRFVTNGDCTLNVAHAVVSPTGDDTFGNMVTELKAMGYTSNARKYVLWADALVYCGIGQVFGDDRSGLDNAANILTGFARIDRGCWGLDDQPVELHELMHTLGAVQPSAPHATAGFHCTDESDRMCYRDADAVMLTYPCPTTQEWLLDCGNDDYFSTRPVAGSYLDTHWNVANSGFLATSLTDDGTDVPPAPTPSPTPVMTTEIFTGSTSAKRPTKNFSIVVGAGTTTSSLDFSTAGKTKTTPTMSLRVLSPDGAVIASGSGISVLQVTAVLPAGSYRVEVSASASLSFTLAVMHPQP